MGAIAGIGMSASKKKGSKKESFEEALIKLEKIVNSLEEGDLSLEKSLKSFEDGMHLVKVCGEQLNQAQKKVEVLVGEKIETLKYEE